MYQSFPGLGNKLPTGPERAFLHDMIQKDNQRIEFLKQQIQSTDTLIAEAMILEQQANQTLNAEQARLRMGRKLLSHYEAISSSTEQVLTDDHQDLRQVAATECIEAISSMQERGYKVVVLLKETLSETNRVLQASEVALKDAQDKKRLQEMRTFYLHSEKEAIQLQIQELVDRIQQKQRNFSVIRKVPPEVWTQIFEYSTEICIKSTSVDRNTISSTLPCPAITLSEVCRDWNAICNSSTRIWSSIILNPQWDGRNRLLVLANCIKKARNAIRLLLVVTKSEESMSPDYSNLFKNVKIVEAIHGAISMSGLPVMHSVLPTLPLCKYISFQNLESTTLTLYLPERFIQGAESLLTTTPTIFQQAGKNFQYFGYILPTFKSRGFGARTWRRMQYLQRLHVDLLDLDPHGSGFPLPPDSAFPLLWEVRAPLRLIPLIFSPSILVPNLRTIKILHSYDANIEDWQNFLAINSHGNTIKELSLPSMSESDYKNIIPFVSMLSSISILELEGSNVDSFIYELTDIVHETMFPHLASLTITNYRGDGTAIQELVEARILAYRHRMDNLQASEEPNSLSMRKIGKVEWINCVNVLPALKWMVIHLCERGGD